MAYTRQVLDFFSKNRIFYSLFLHNTDQKRIASKYISFKLAAKTDTTSLRFLCIGGGPGDADLSIIRKLRPKSFVIDYIDPLEEMAKSFIDKAKRLGLARNLGDIRIEKFESPAYVPNKVDIIFCINSLYFIEGWKEKRKHNPLIKLYNCLNEDGIAVIVIRSNESDHTYIKKAAGGGRTTGSLVRSMLTKLNISYFFEVVPSHINISSCFRGDKFKPDKTCVMLLNFLFGARWSKLSESKKNKVIRLLNSKTNAVKGKKLLEASHEYIWIYKNTSKEAYQTIPIVSHKSIALETKLREKIRTVPDFPIRGILFRDTTKLLRDGELFKKTIRHVTTLLRNTEVDFVVAKDMQGLIWAGAIASSLGCGIIPMFRKDLAGELISANYAHEYNPNRIVNLQKEAIKPGDRIILVDYIMATGETLRVMSRLIEHLGGIISGIFVLIEISNLNGRKGLEKYEIYSLVKY